MKSTHYTYEGGSELYLLIINDTYCRNQLYLVVFSTIARSEAYQRKTYWCTLWIINQPL